jgi:tight adherence protein C
VESAIAPLLAFGCVFFLVAGLAAIVRPRVAASRLTQLSAPPPVAPGPSKSLVRREETGLLGFFNRVGSRRETQELGQFRLRFVQAGFKRPAAPAIFYGIRLTLALGIPAIAGLVPWVWSLSTLQQISLIGALTLLAYVGPSVYLNRRRARRQLALTQALPDCLDLLVICIEAGLGINQGLARVAEEFRNKCPDLSLELALVGHETRAGKTTPEALRSLADRTGVADISSFVALLVQTERFGTSVASVLRVHADAIRIRRMQRAEEKAQLATLKLILPSTMIFAALLVVFLAPGMYRFFGAFSSLP